MKTSSIAHRMPWLFALLCAAMAAITARAADERWPEAKVNAWYVAQPWPVGANYLPRTAINQLEMWQAETFDPATIDQELGWAEAAGMNVMRVFLHDILWETDRAGLLARMETFLQIADRHRIRTLFVFFDGVWDPHPHAGPQRPPRPFVHNSGWVQSPGREILRDPVRQDALQPYVQGVLRHFRDDSRIFGWDLFNEPDNGNATSYGAVELASKVEAAQRLLEKCFAWAREVAPTQPLTAGVWQGRSALAARPPIVECMLQNSDFVSFHHYENRESMARLVAALKALTNRPIVCTEYMSRGRGSTFDPVLGDFKTQAVGAIHWGLVNGKSQTIYPWDSWGRNYTGEPELWFHDVFRADGSAYRPEEIAYIKSLTRGR